MSTFRSVSKMCSVCGTMSDHTVICSTNTFGSPDLDLRPPEMKRSTMVYWPEQCPQCGFVAYDIAKRTPVSREWLSEKRYITCEGHNFLSSLAVKFYKIYLIAKETGNNSDAFNALMSAAWACDDCNDYKNARLCRSLLLPCLDVEIKNTPQRADTLSVIKADVLRRAGLFDQVVAEYTNCTFGDETLTKICEFQVEKARQGDAGCYRVSDVK